MTDLTPLWLSLKVSLWATGLAALLGTALAWTLTRLRGPLASLLDGLVHLPLVLPPTVLGYYLLVAFGARSPLGAWLQSHGLALTFTWRGAVLAAFIVALPLVTQSAHTAFASVPRDLEEVALSLGRSPWAVFWTITFPLAWRGIAAGIALAFSRALGEFGATLMVAGNIPGQTQTLPMAIYQAVQLGDQAQANRLALLLTSVALLILLLIRRWGGRR